MSGPFRMPILPPLSERGGARLAVYFEPTKADREQAERNHGGQSLERLRERGGVSWCELAAILSNRPHSRMDQNEARRECERRLTHGPTPHQHGAGNGEKHGG